MNDIPRPSTEIIQSQQQKLLVELENNNKSCNGVKNALSSIISAVIVSSKKSSKDNDLNDNESSSKIVADGKDEEIAQYQMADASSMKEDDIPGLSTIMSLISEGKVSISEEVFKELNLLNAKADANSEEASNLQARWSALDASIKTLKKEIEDINQYFRYDDLLLHNFPPPPRGLSSIEFSQFIAEQINYFVPNLPFPVSWQHISDAHPLRTKSKKSSVVIVRFCNRNVRHAVYEQSAFINQKGLAITEHLTEKNLTVLKKAKELFGFNNAWTYKCNTIINFNGSFKKVYSVEDINVLFKQYTAKPKATKTPQRYQSRTPINKTQGRFRRPLYNDSYNDSYTHRMPYNTNNYTYNNYDRQQFSQDRRGYGGDMNYRSAVLSH